MSLDQDTPRLEGAPASREAIEHFCEIIERIYFRRTAQEASRTGEATRPIELQSNGIKLSYSPGLLGDHGKLMGPPQIHLEGLRDKTVVLQIDHHTNAVDSDDALTEAELIRILEIISSIPDFQCTEAEGAYLTRQYRDKTAEEIYSLLLNGFSFVPPHIAQEELPRVQKELRTAMTELKRLTTERDSARAQISEALFSQTTADNFNLLPLPLNGIETTIAATLLVILTLIGEQLVRHSNIELPAIEIQTPWSD